MPVAILAGGISSAPLTPTITQGADAFSDSGFVVVDGFTRPTFAELQEEFYARGYDYLNEDDAGRRRAKRWLNQAYFALCSAFPWPFLEVTLEQNAPLQIDDVDHVLSVRDADNNIPLAYIDRMEVVANYDVTATGRPCHWFWQGNTISTSPGSSVTLSVEYVRKPLRLAADDGRLIVPAEYMDLIVDGAVIKALKDSDNWEARREARDEYDIQLGLMAETLMIRQAEPDSILRT